MTLERAWRCEACGKWSHAQRKPRSHTRFAGEFSRAVQEAEGARLPIEWVDGGMETDTGAPLVTAKIKCGPFVEYRLERVAA